MFYCTTLHQLRVVWPIQNLDSTSFTHKLSHQELFFYFCTLCYPQDSRSGSIKENTRQLPLCSLQDRKEDSHGRLRLLHLQRPQVQLHCLCQIVGVTNVYSETKCQTLHFKMMLCSYEGIFACLRNHILQDLRYHITFGAQNTFGAFQELYYFWTCNLLFGLNFFFYFVKTTYFHSVIFRRKSMRKSMWCFSQMWVQVA